MKLPLQDEPAVSGRRPRLLASLPARCGAPLCRRRPVVAEYLVNALAILIFMSQVPELIGVPWLVYPVTALGLLIVFGLPC